MSYTEIKTQKTNPHFVPAIPKRQIGWLAFADGFPIDEVQHDDEMRHGWLQALRDAANADVWAMGVAA